MHVRKTFSVKLFRVDRGDSGGKKASLKIGRDRPLGCLAYHRIVQHRTVVVERQARRDAVIQDIAQSSSGEQQLTGPILIGPYEKTVREWRENDRGDRDLEERRLKARRTRLTAEVRKPDHRV